MIRRLIRNLWPETRQLLFFVVLSAVFFLMSVAGCASPPPPTDLEAQVSAVHTVGSRHLFRTGRPARHELSELNPGAALEVRWRHEMTELYSADLALELGSLRNSFEDWAPYGAASATFGNRWLRVGGFLGGIGYRPENGGARPMAGPTLELGDWWVIPRLSWLPPSRRNGGSVLLLQLRFPLCRTKTHYQSQF